VATDIAERFAKETAEHDMEIVHDDGLYRHLRFRHQGPNYSSWYWFDLITVPGSLIFRGDGDGEPVDWEQVALKLALTDGADYCRLTTKEAEALRQIVDVERARQKSTTGTTPDGEPQ
jgi:hypothetical protein